MKVLPTQNGDAVTAQPADTQVDDASTASFKSVLASATPETDVKLHKGEKIQHVEGHAYAEVTAGDREGMYINTSGNVRNGQAFVLVRKHGKEYHIYGTGKDRLVVGFHVPKKASNDAASEPKADLSDIKLRKGEKIEPVEGHAYAEIVSGPRSGMYINTSQNGRRGEAFVLVEKADFNYHIYGSGDDRVVIRANKREVDKD
jgi:tRNA U34 2-thiouridine synthase MnmA/TrmU